MVRPKKDFTQRRSSRVEVRLTIEEEQVLLDLSQERGMTLSDFLRSTALGVKPRILRANPERAALIRALAELGKIGSNVNQIARAMNRQLAAGHPVNLPESVITHLLNNLKALSNHLIQKLSDGH